MCPYIRAANITWHGIDVSDVKEMDFTAREQETYRLRRGDILLSEASGSASEVGKPAVWQDEVPGACFQNTVIRVRATDPRDVPYLYWSFVNDALNGNFAEQSRGTGIHHLGGKKMEDWPMAIPPLAEQRRIITAIETQFTRLAEAVPALHRVQQNLKRARASVLKAAVEGRLVPTQAALARSDGRVYETGSALLDRILTERRARWVRGEARGVYREPVTADLAGVGQLPLGWVWASCDQAGEILLGRRRAPEYTGEERSYLRVANVRDGLLSLGDVQRMPFEDAEFEKYQLQTGDVLVSEGQSPELVGQSALYLGAPSPCAFQATLHRFRPDSSSVLPRYAETVFRAWVRGGVFRKRCIVTTNIGHLTLGRFKSVPFPLPPLAEQHRIVAEVDRRLSVLDAIELTVNADLARCARLRQSILKRAFEGRLVPPEPVTTGEQQILLSPQDAAR